SQTDFLVKVLKNCSPSSITNPSLLRTMQAALSSVNCGLNSNPSFEKNSLLRLRSRTGRLTKILRAMFSSKARMERLDGFVCSRQLRDVELVHLHQGIHHAPRPCRVLVLQQPLEAHGDDLPRQAEFVFQPAALTRLSARGELPPELVELLLGLAVD